MKGFLGALEHWFVMQGQHLWDPRLGGMWAAAPQTG